MSSENGRQLVPTDGGEQLSVEEREGRWDSAVALMMRVLELYNPGVTDEHFKRSIFQKDVFGAATYQEGKRISLSRSR